MSTPTTTTRGTLLRRAGTLLVAAVLVVGAAASAVADPTAGPDPTASATASPSPSATVSGEPSPSTPAVPTPTATSATPAPTTSSTQAPTATTPASPDANRRAGASDATLLAAAGTAVPETAHAADFIARTLAAGGHHYVYPNSTYFDGGNTIDAILALDAAGAGSDEADAAFDHLEANVGGYIGTDYASTYAGPTAKALLAVVAHGGDPTSFGGLDLVAELRATEGAVEPGRFSDLPVDCGYSPCDYSNTIGQSLALIGLVRAGQAISTASVDLLLAQQCSDGGFRGVIGAATCTSDPDATGFAAQALMAVGSAAPAAQALDWLADAQAGNGSLVSADGVANANTTGVAAQAFAAGGRDEELAFAQAFLTSLQYDCSAPVALRGGLAFSLSTLSTTTPSDSDLRATPQGTLGLSGQSLLSAAALEGASAGTTALPCAATPTGTGDATPTTTPTGSGPATAGAGGSDPSPTAGATPTGSLARTGTDLLLPVGLGLALVLLGALAVAASRRRGTHA